MAKRKPSSAPGAPVVIQAVDGVVNISAGTFASPADYVAVKNTLGIQAYVGPIFRVDQFGHFVENVWPKVTMNAAVPNAMRIVKPMDWHDTSGGALYDPTAVFGVVITYQPDHSFYVDEFGNPVLKPRYLVEIS